MSPTASSVANIEKWMRDGYQPTALRWVDAMSAAKPYDAEQLRIVALGALDSTWYPLRDPAIARDVIRRLIATLDERNVEIARQAGLGQPVVDAARVLQKNVGKTTGPMWSALDRAFEELDPSHEPKETAGGRDACGNCNGTRRHGPGPCPVCNAADLADLDKK